MLRAVEPLVTLTPVRSPESAPEVASGVDEGMQKECNIFYCKLSTGKKNDYNFCFSDKHLSCLDRIWFLSKLSCIKTDNEDNEKPKEIDDIHRTRNQVFVQI